MTQPGIKVRIIETLDSAERYRVTFSEEQIDLYAKLGTWPDCAQEGLRADCSFVVTDSQIKSPSKNSRQHHGKNLEFLIIHGD